jgi:hypothetical protein
LMEIEALLVRLPNLLWLHRAKRQLGAGAAERPSLTPCPGKQLDSQSADNQVII